MPRDQIDLFRAPPKYPEGFRYQPEVIDAATEARMLERIAALPFREFEFQGYTAKRRVISFGWQYDFSAERLDRVEARARRRRSGGGSPLRRRSTS